MSTKSVYRSFCSSNNVSFLDGTLQVYMITPVTAITESLLGFVQKYLLSGSILIDRCKIFTW